MIFSIASIIPILKIRMITSRSPRPPQPAGPRCAPRSHRSLRCLRRPGGIDAVSPFDSARHRIRTSCLPSRLVRRSRCSRLTRPSHGARWRTTRRRPPASARHVYCHVGRCKPVQSSSWWNERARPGRGVRGANERERHGMGERRQRGRPAGAATAGSGSECVNGERSEP